MGSRKISEAHSEAARRNIAKANESGKNRRYGAANPKWNNGSRTRGSYS